MTKVTVDTDAKPAAAANSAASEPELSVVTDSAGRELTIKQPSILQESRLVRAMGDSAMNAAYMSGYVLPAAMVIRIDGAECLFPLVQGEVDAAIQRVGRHGLAAIMAHLTTRSSPEGDADAIKKSQGTPDSKRPAG